MSPTPRTRTPAPPPGRVVATLHEVDASARDDAPSTGHVSRPPTDARVYDDWTAEAERDAAEALLAARAEPPPPAEELTLEPSAEAPARPAPRGAWLLVGGLGATGAALLAGGLLAGLAAVLALGASLW